MKLAFFADFRGENYNRNTTKRKTITFVKGESNLFNGKREKKYNFAPKLEAATLAGARVNFTDSAETFLVSKWSRIFQISFLTCDFQDSENETPNKRIK